MPRQVLTRILLPAAVVIAESCDIKACKRSDLPIYVPEPKKAESTSVKYDETVGVIEDSIRTVRKSITSLYRQVQDYENKGMDYVNKGIADTEWLINYLGEEDNIAPKGPAIAIGGLAGLILGLRGGFFRKVIFTTAGAAGMAAICYPKEASEYSKIAIDESKTYATIAYNFIYGVKKGDPPLELPSLPKLPNSVGEAWGMVTNLGKSVSEKEESRVGKINYDEEFTLDTNFDTSEESLIPDPSTIVSQIHKEATHKDCHCPVGVCLNHREEKDNHPSTLPSTPTVPYNDICEE